MCSLMFVEGCNYVVVTWLGNALSMDDDRRTRPISAILFVNAYEKKNRQESRLEWSKNGKKELRKIEERW